MVSHLAPALPTQPVYQSSLFGFPILSPVVIPCGDGDPLDCHDDAVNELRSAYSDWATAQSLMAQAQARLHTAIAVERHTRAALAVGVS